MTDTTAVEGAPAPTGGEDDAGRRGRLRWVALVVLLTAVFMDMVDNQIVSIALPTIQRGLGASDAALQWIASGYTFAFALTLITGGRLGDRFGQRAVFAVGAAGFGLASLAAGAAPTVELLVAARVAQGVFSGLMVPQVLAFIQAEFGADERGRAMAAFGITFPLGGVAGPLLGGVLTQANLFGLGWRTIFLVNLPVAAVATVAAALTMPRPRTVARGRVDLVGAVVLGAAMLAVLYPLVQGRELGWPWWTALLFAAAAPLLALFVVLQRRRLARGAEPLVRLALFRRRSLSAGLVVSLPFFASMGAFFVLSLHLQDGLHYSPLRTALTFLPAAVGIVAGNAFGMPLAKRLGRRLTMVGVGVLVLGNAGVIAAVVGFGADLTWWQLAVPIVLDGAGLGLGASSLMLVTLTDVEPADAGSASGVVSTVGQLGQAAGPALLGTVFFGQLGGAGYATATGLALGVGLCVALAALLGCLALPRAR